MRKPAKELSHSLIRKPRRPYCDCCARAQPRETPHRRNFEVTEVATEFGDVIAGDFLTAQDDHVRSVGTGVKIRYPTNTRDADECTLALEKFVGMKTRPNLFYFDKEAGLLAAGTRLSYQLPTRIAAFRAASYQHHGCAC